MLNKARNLAVGMAVGFSAVIVAQCLDVVRAGFDHLSATGYFSLGVFIATVLGGVNAAEIRPGRRSVAAHDQSAGARMAAMVVAGIGGVCWFLGQCLNRDRSTLTLIGGSAQGVAAQSSSCCTFGGSGDWQKAILICTCAVLLLLAVFAATARSRRRGAGMLIAATLAALPNILSAVYGAISPPAPDPGFSVHVVLLAGFWITVGGVVLVLGAGVLRLTAGRSRPTAGPAAVAFSMPVSRSVPVPVPVPVPAPVPGATLAPAAMGSPALPASPAAAAFGDGSTTG